MKRRAAELLDLDHPLRGPLFDSLATRLASTPGSLQAGARVGPYRVVRALGQGGMGQVYLAARADGEFEQEVAIKMLAADRGDGARRELLRRERQILARLQHPRIARLLDGGSTAEGAIWFAMEPVAGERIDHYCRGHGLGLQARVQLVLDVCDAVGFAHSQLLVHGDIKPSNILVTDAGEVKLLDFGIAGILSSDTDIGAAPRALSPAHASPEQLRGEAVGTASDIWQLGRLLDTLTHADTGPRLRSASPADLAAIIARATATSPESRYGSVPELTADLVNFLHLRPVTARRGGSGYRLGRFLHRRRYAVGATGLAMLAFAGLAVHSAWSLARQRDIALLNAERANATTGFLLSLFASAEPNRQRGETLTANQILEIGERRLDVDLADQPALRASLLSTIAQVHLTLGQYPRAERLLSEAVRLSQGRDDIDRLQLAYRLRELARAQWRQDEFDKALVSASEGEQLLQGDERHASLRMLLLNTQASIAVRLGRYADAVRIETDAIRMARAHLPGTQKALAYAWNNLAAAQRGLGQHQAALSAYREALSALRNAVGEDHSDYHSIAGEYAIQLALAGYPDEALTISEAALSALRRLLPENNGALDAGYRAYAEAALRAGRADLAQPAAERALRGALERSGEDSLMSASIAAILGQSLLEVGRPSEAAPHLLHALRVHESRLPAEHPDIGMLRAAVRQASCRRPLREPPPPPGPVGGPASTVDSIPAAAPCPAPTTRR